MKYITYTIYSEDQKNRTETLYFGGSCTITAYIACLTFEFSKDRF